MMTRHMIFELVLDGERYRGYEIIQPGHKHVLIEKDGERIGAVDWEDWEIWRYDILATILHLAYPDIFTILEGGVQDDEPA